MNRAQNMQRPYIGALCGEEIQEMAASMSEIELAQVGMMRAGWAAGLNDSVIARAFRVTRRTVLKRKRLSRSMPGHPESATRGTNPGGLSSPEPRNLP